MLLIYKVDKLLANSNKIRTTNAVDETFIILPKSYQQLTQIKLSGNYCRSDS